uniref:Uncharacterized protein n=1 Tax=Rhizophora mucronata TaxID=61149 RepID=A0A2P2KZC6_RHIMU
MGCTHLECAFRFKRSKLKYLRIQDDLKTTCDNRLQYQIAAIFIPKTKQKPGLGTKLLFFVFNVFSWVILILSACQC